MSLEPQRVQKVVDSLKVIAENTCDDDLKRESEQVLQSLQDGDDPRRYIKNKIYECKRCGEEYYDVHQAQGHYNGDVQCDGEPRWTNDFDGFKDQFEIRLEADTGP